LEDFLPVRLITGPIDAPAQHSPPPVHVGNHNLSRPKSAIQQVRFGF
jgi:hypothetical protein